MIVKIPTNTYERQIFDIIKNRQDFLELKTVVDKVTKKERLVPIWSEGDKGIIYDLCTEYIPKHAEIDFENIHLGEYITTVKNLYKHHGGKLSPLIIKCVNALGLEYINPTKVQ